MFKKKVCFLFGVMVFLSLIGYAVCLMAGSNKQIREEEEFLLVTSFYPMYVLAENLTEGVEGVTVSNLTENQTGCLHDYQLTSRDMKLLSQADAFLFNGAGMELFMEKVLENNPELPVVEATYGMDLLEGIEHHHGHEEEEEHAEEHGENGHVWMDVTRYRKQVTTVKEKLQQLLPEQKDALEAAAGEYDKKLQELELYAEELREYTEGTPVVVFHEAFVYLAERLGMEVLAVLSLDEDTVPSAGEIAEVIEEINHHGGACIFIEREHGDYADKICREAEASVYYLDPLTTGGQDGNSYLTEMKKNLDTLLLLKKQ